MTDEPKPDEPNDAPLFKVFPHLREALQKEMDAFLQRLHAKSADEHALVGRVAHCHMLLEHHLAKHIETLLPQIGDLSKLRLNFIPLLRLGEGLTHPESMVQMVAKEMRALNELRNTVAHNLNADLSQNRHLGALREFIKAMGIVKLAPLLEPIKVIQVATMFVVSLLSTGSVRKREGDARDQELEQKRDALEKRVWDINTSLLEAMEELFGDAVNEVRDEVPDGPKE